MAVRTHNVALGDFGHQTCGGHQHRSPGHQIERLGRWISMVEVHLVRREFAPAVNARNIANFAQELRRPCLTHLNARQLEIAVTPVVRHVCWPLTRPHAPL
jgi:hypothetical protein